MVIYLDYNATTPLSPEVASFMADYAARSAAKEEGAFGNPSSAHSAGCAAACCFDEYSTAIKRHCGLAEGDTATILSGGSEINSRVIAGGVVAAVRAARAAGQPDWRPHIVLTSVEHPSVVAAAQWATDLFGADVATVECGPDGLVDPACLAAAVIPGRTVVVAVLACNHELGTIQPIAKAAAAVRAAAAEQAMPFPGRWPIVHADTAQFFGKVPLSFAALGADTAAVVGHKVGAPRGAAALLMRGPDEHGATMTDSLVCGAKQQSGRRPGTEPTLLAGALATALAWLDDPEASRTGVLACVGHQENFIRTLWADLSPEARAALAVHGPLGAHWSPEAGCIAPTWRDAVEKALSSRDGTQMPASPSVLSFTVEGVVSGPLLATQNKVAVSTGPACCGGGASPVLLACGFPYSRAAGAFRVSWDRRTSPDDVAAGARALADLINNELRN